MQRNPEPSTQGSSCPLRYGGTEGMEGIAHAFVASVALCRHERVCDVHREVDTEADAQIPEADSSDSANGL